MTKDYKTNGTKRSIEITRCWRAETYSPTGLNLVRL